MLNLDEMRENLRRHTNIKKAPRPTMERRLALFIFQRGLTEKQIDKFKKIRRRDQPPRFDYLACAEEYKVSLDWLAFGDLAKHPKISARPPAQSRQKPYRKFKCEYKEAIRDRVRNIAMTHGLTADDIKPAMTTKHYDLVCFSDKYSINIEWLVTGKGQPDTPESA
jgi:hypothetical protein